MPDIARGHQEARRRELRLVLRRRRIRTQEDLAEALRERGYEITQSSLSRDLTSLGARKVDGSYRLVSETDAAEEAGQLYPTLSELQPFVRALRTAGPNLLVVATRPGLAQTVALALDSMSMPEVVGTVAGDDTVFVATPSRRAQRSLERRFGRLMVPGT
ncbi:MAG TPA: arginine repressor [Planctomycetota bacterium]|nr:arginine repressor [Planctomycetota bacterium]